MKDLLSLSAQFSAFGSDLANVDSREDLLGLIARHFNQQLTFSDILLSIVNEDKQTHSVSLYHADPARQEKCEYASLSQEKFRMEDGVCNIAMASPSPLVVDIATILLRPDPPRYIARWYRPAISRMIAVRLRSHNQLLGALFFFFEKAHIGINDLDMVQHFSYMIAPALKNILADEKFIRQQQDNKTLLSLSTDFVRALDKEDLFRMAGVRLRQLFEFDHSCIALVDKENKMFTFDGDNARKAINGTPYDDSLTEAALAADYPLVFDLDGYISPEASEYIRYIRDRGITEAVMMSLRKEGESFGFLILFNATRGRCTSRHLDILHTLCRQLSIAYCNILTHEALREREHDKTLILSLGRDITSARNEKDLLAAIDRALRQILPGTPLISDMDQLIKGIGGAFIHPKGKGQLSARSLSQLEELSAQISIGVSNIRAYEELESRLEEILRHKLRLEEENLYLQEQIRTAHGITGMIGSGSAMQKLFQLMSIVSSSDSTVLILGEPGTGKELVAAAIHNASSRKDKCMIKVDCAALPAHLVESELFGHEKVSFTGAVERRIGKLALASGSTLFLDEIGELPPELQTRLLRAIQEQADVRIIAASHRNLRKEVEAGRFDSDLFQRLNVFPIHLPPLRERKEDLPLLAAHFISQQTRRSGKKIANISQRALASIMSYDWPGNVRELEHLIERSVLMTTGPTIKDIPLPTGIAAGFAHLTQGSPLKTLEELERDHILAVLNNCGHKVGGPGGAAELLRLPATTLHSKIKKLGIKKDPA